MAKQPAAFNLKQRLQMTQAEMTSAQPITAVPPLMKEAKADETNTNANTKLCVNGRLDRKSNKYIQRSLTINESIFHDIQAVCKGSEQAIYNYLLNEGLKKIKSSESFILIDVQDIENQYK